MLRTFVIVCIGYVFDIAPSFRQAMWTFKMILTRQSISTGLSQIKAIGMGYSLIAIGAIVVLLVSIIQERFPNMKVRERLDKIPFVVRWCIVLAAVLFIAIYGMYGPGYNAADFVYAQF